MQLVYNVEAGTETRWQRVVGKQRVPPDGALSSLGKLFDWASLARLEPPCKGATLCFEVTPRDAPKGEITPIITGTAINSYWANLPWPQARCCFLRTISCNPHNTVTPWDGYRYYLCVCQIKLRQRSQSWIEISTKLADGGTQSGMQAGPTPKLRLYLLLCTPRVPPGSSWATWG